MFYSTPWTSDPRFQPYIYPINVIYPGNQPIPFQDTACISKAEEELNQLFRLLWEQHVAWTRMLIISIAASLPDESLVTERLLRNPPDMAEVFKRFYGNEIAARFSSLTESERSPLPL
ncbi:hypothetical protein [Cohnella silvisoli]|uniref:Uncharacterized protein n=1 Tax=Cohnella silvisoli TaxID=2873699 RepID=A0ABV1KXM8_9BACL|nr:hypothetical protein [Cohnella silvisoli]MCD9021958.1 hypothetical protein [Cohnella silvisoli]